VDHPDWLVLDLDPKGAPFTDVVAVALELHRMMDALDVPSYVKTSGATGLHVLVPLGARYTHEDARSFARLLAVLGEQAMPGLATTARPINARAGKVYIDFGQNGHGKTIAAPYSVRPLPGATVSCPLAWTEVNEGLDPTRFTIRTVPERFRRHRDPLLPVLDVGIDMAAAIARIEKRLGGGGAGVERGRAAGGGPGRTRTSGGGV
jgi:bifunctional non-homologous end joining protein LigD